MELTKKDLEQTILASENRITDRIIKRIDEAQEELARMTKRGFDDVFERLDVHERVGVLEKDMRQLKTVLHLS